MGHHRNSWNKKFLFQMLYSSSLQCMCSTVSVMQYSVCFFYSVIQSYYIQRFLVFYCFLWWNISPFLSHTQMNALISSLEDLSTLIIASSALPHITSAVPGSLKNVGIHSTVQDIV